MKENKPYLIIEFTLLFIVIPLIFYFEWVNIPKIPSLVFLTLFALVVLLRDRTFDRAKLRNIQTGRSFFLTILKRFALVSIVLTIYTYLFFPDLFFVFPKTRPLIWIIVMIFYPLLSALPQELVYRSFLFQRYKILFPRDTVMIIVSSVAFSFLHIMYDNFHAIMLSLLGGLLFTLTYYKSKSLFWVSVEHALYGCFVFTVGLGRFFYEGY